MMLMSRRKMIAAIAAGPNMPVKYTTEDNTEKRYIYIYIKPTIMQ